MNEKQQQYIDGLEDPVSRQRAIALLIAKELLTSAKPFTGADVLTDEFPANLCTVAEYILYGYPEIDPNLEALLSQMQAEGLIEQVTDDDAG